MNATDLVVAAAVAVSICSLLAMATWSAGVAVVHWFRNRHETVETIPAGDSYQALADALGIGTGNPDMAQLYAPMHGGFPAPVRTVHVRPITPTKDEMLALRASAQTAAEEYARTGRAVTNPYPAGSRKGIVWATFYLDAQMTAEFRLPHA